jgi:YVTN family beta-propeller protein
LAALFAATLLLSACQAVPSLVKPRLEDNGGLYVYLRPLPAEADRLAFRLDGIFAVREDGQTFPLSLRVREFTGKELRRERLLGYGELPPGRYSGLSFKPKDATLEGEEGKIALALSEEMPRASIPFDVTRKRAVVVSLQFQYRESVRDGFRFAPSFSAMIPGRLATGLIGLLSSGGANIVTLFDKSSGQVAAVIPAGVSPAGIALDPARRRAYVAVSGEDSVEAIDLLEGTVVDRQRLIAGDRPGELALTPDGKTLLSANSGSGTVSLIDSSSLIETKRVKVGAGPQSVLVDRTGRKAYVFNSLSNTISVVDIVSGAVAATVAAESGPVRGQFNRAGNRLYVLHRNSPFLSVIDPLSLGVIRRVNVGAGGTALKVDSRTDLIYLAKRFSEDIDVYDPFSFLPIDTVRAGGEASYLAIDGEGNNLIIVSPGMNRLRIVHLVGKGTVAEIDVGDDPYRVAIMGER